MRPKLRGWQILLAGLLVGALARAVPAAMPPVNVIEHGIPVPAGEAITPSATVDADGRRIIVCKLAAGGKTSYLFIDAESGETEQLPAGLSGSGSNGVLMTPENAIFDSVGGYFLRLDIPTRTVRRLGRVGGVIFGGGFVRTSDGTVYGGFQPTATLVSYNPATDTYTDHGQLNEESWRQYLRPLAVDASGWVYGGIGMERMQVVAFNPATGEKRPLIPEKNRKRGYQPVIFKGTDGQVYARADRYQFGGVLEIYEDGWGWHVLSEGRATPIAEPPVGGVRQVNHVFPDGSHFSGFNVLDREVLVHDVGAKEPRRVRFSYESPGVRIYNLVAGPDGRVYGSTGNPLRFWCYDPAGGEFWDRGVAPNDGHINQFVRQGDRLYGITYSQGYLFEYDPSRPYALEQNPRLAHRADEAGEQYGRPHAMLAHPDGRHILAAGHASRVLLGSGMLIYDVKAESGQIIDRARLMPEHGIYSLAALPDGQVLAGTSIHPSTAGTAGPARTAMIYRYNMETGTVSGQWPLSPETPAVRELVVAPDGLVYGLAEPDRLFVFDPVSEEIIRSETLAGYGGIAGGQAPRCMTIGPDGAIYALFQEAVVRIEPATLAHRAIARPGEAISAGIAMLGDRIYFACGTRLFSCGLNE